ncbi:hypothetical protein AB0B41_06170, partial [Pseudonocardia sp. NPDC049154]
MLGENVIGVGIVGLSAARGWAARAHLPALRAQPERFAVRASCASSPESGRAGAEAPPRARGGRGPAAGGAAPAARGG